MRLRYTAPVIIMLGLLVFSACVPNLDFGCNSEPAATPVPTGPVHAEFSANPTMLQGKGQITFTSHSTGHIKEWYWDLDGDGIADTIGPQVKHYYNENGHYTVTLTVEGWDGSSDTLTKTDYVYVYGCST